MGKVCLLASTKSDKTSKVGEAIYVSLRAVIVFNFTNNILWQ